MNKEQNTNESKEDITFDVRPSTVFYEQWYKTIKGMPLKERDKAYKYIFEYAFYGIEPDEPDRDKMIPMSYVAFSMAQPNIDSAHKRYDAACENGQKSNGRPKKVTEEVIEKIQLLRKNGMTQKQVASELSLSLKTIQRVERDKSQNHNNNVNDNVNEKENLNLNSVASYVAYTQTAPPKKNYPSDKPVKKKDYDDLSEEDCNQIFAKFNLGKTEEELTDEFCATEDAIKEAIRYKLFN